jgi:hypothetical protein
MLLVKYGWRALKLAAFGSEKEGEGFKVEACGVFDV